MRPRPFSAVATALESHALLERPWLLSLIHIFEIKQSVFADNNREADSLRAELKGKGLFLLNLMSSPGSGKTTTLVRTIEALRGELRIGIMEADIDSDVDAHTVQDAGAKAVQLHTGGTVSYTHLRGPL